MQIKMQLGKLDLDMPIKELIESQQQANALQILPVELHHVFELTNLPPLHSDPFDRILIAQSNAEGLTIVSKDQKFSDYPVTIIW
jgi:PIN domain nuclease of toxin-antitoxin system